MTPLSTLLALLAAPAAPPVDFNRDVRPILSANCFSCHGFDAKSRKAKLRLDTPEGAYAARDGVTPVKPGDPSASEVWERVTTDDETLVMPPPETNKTLTARQKATLKAWIEQGAKYRKHWSFEPIARPPVPPGDAVNPVDRFLNARLAAEKLAPAPEADRETLIRRAAFALTGLPPTPAEVDAFLADARPGAYERAVDRYLASPRYGEEMARHWLDVARYADTHGLHLDNERSMWGYRDWVVSAFNRDLPYDRFTVEQLAGDLLPGATPDQVAATGFNRCNVTTSEGGSIDAEWLYRNAVDRTSTAMQAWLGLTGGCCQCHDHKYDPVSQKEFYSLYAFFYSAADPGLDGNVNNTMPFLRLPTPAQKAAAEAAGKVEAAARSWLDTAAWFAAYSEPAAGRVPVRDLLVGDAFPVGATSRSSSRNPVEWTAGPPAGPAEGQRSIRQASAVGYSDTVEFKLRPVVVPHDAALEVWLWPDPTDVPASVSVGVPGAKTVTWSRKGDALVWSGVKSSPKRAIRGRAAPPPPAGDPNPPAHDAGLDAPAGRWTKLVIPAADLGLEPGRRLDALTLSQTGGVAYWDGVTLAGEADPAADPLASFAAWRKAVGTNPPPELPGELHAAVRAGPNGKLKPEDEAKLRQFFLAVVARTAGDLAPARAAWEAARAARITAEESAPGTFVFRDLDKPREAFVMLRGQYDKPGERVRPGVPAVLPPLKAAKADAADRLDLARWLVSPEQPLTARVAANRLWQQLFGVGLVKTGYDFGSQGDPPSHPELLDWLAAELRDSGWGVKRFVKLLVTSDAFRRASRQTPELRQRDPDNRLLARGPRFRLDAEQLRDNALFVSGLLNPEMGGRGVKPYQPPNVWEPVGYGDSNTRYYQQDHGPALYRRSLYAFIKRTAPPPFLVNFDAPNREQFCTVRDRTNTPLQALQLMNDVQHFEAARALAERAVAEGGSTAESRVAFLYRTVLGRRPDADEARAVAAAYEKQLALYKADPKAAGRAVAVGESRPRNMAPAAETAAWAVVANLVLNLDETVNRN